MVESYQDFDPIRKLALGGVLAAGESAPHGAKCPKGYGGGSNFRKDTIQYLFSIYYKDHHD
jgi:hypothetical protein